MRAPAREALVPVLIAGAAVLVVAVAVVQEQLREIPHVPYEFVEYVGVTPEDLGTQELFDDEAGLVVRLRARAPGRVRFLVVGDGGTAHDPGKRALVRRMRALCRAEPCDFVLFTGDNVYEDGVDTFVAVASRAFPRLDLQDRFLAGRDAAAALATAERVRVAAGLVSRACGGARLDPYAGSMPRAAAASAAEARRRHFVPKFERSFAWLAEEGIPAFMVLGNHDWRSPFSSECQIGWTLDAPTAWRLPFYFYRVEVVDPASEDPLADLLALYSAPPHGSPEGENHAWLGPRQRAWLRRALAASRARWRMAASHHPIWSAGPHTFLEYRSFHTDVLEELRAESPPLDLLLAGHNHWLESVEVPLPGRAGAALQVVSGSLAKVAFGKMLLRGYPVINGLALQPIWRIAMAQQLGTDPTAFLRRGRSVLTRGFALVELGRDEATVRFFGTSGELYAERLPSASMAIRSIRPSGSRATSVARAQRNGGATGGLDPAPAAGRQTTGDTNTRRWE